MENSSSEMIFVLHGLNDTRTNKYIYFAFGLVAYIMTLCINLIIVMTVILEKTLHEPMYLFICNLFVNGLCGASALYPKILISLLLDDHLISYIGCLSQIYFICCYVICEYTCLTVMSYDRYIAICKPLEYHSIMTLQKGIRLLIFTWFCSLLEAFVLVYPTSRLTLCRFYIEKIYCSNWDLVKLSCSDVTTNNMIGYVLIVYHFSHAMFIFVSYIIIIKASLKSKTKRVKFMQTCLPHLITLINYTISVLFDLMYARYGNNVGTLALRNVMGIEFLVVPPLINPIIYGIKLNQIRHAFVKMYRNRIKCLKHNG